HSSSLSSLPPSPPLSSPLFPYTTLFRSSADRYRRPYAAFRPARRAPGFRAATGLEGMSSLEVEKRPVVSTAAGCCYLIGAVIILDRKSTRLNSSHQIISYAVFCLKKKKN